MAGVNEKLFSIGCFKKISATEAECVPCTAESTEPKRLKTINYSSSSLLRHLPKHPEFLKKYEDLNKHQPTVTRYLTTSVGSLSVLDRRVLNLVACCNLSFNMINHPTFQALFVLNKHSEQLKDESHYRNKVLPHVYKLVVARVQYHLDQCQFLSFTSDVWSGPCNAFISLTVHGITKQWNRFMFVLAVREFSGSHTGARIEQIVYDLLGEWNLNRDRVHVILHDQASSMISAFEASEVEDADCGAHKLNLIPVIRIPDVDAELNRFIREPLTDWEEDPVDYWRRNHERYPLLAPVARRFLAAPATSVASEQLFSTAKIVFDSRRCRLTPRTAEMLVFLSRNLPLLNYHY